MAEGSKKRRAKQTIIVDILKNAKDGVRKTHIMYKVGACMHAERSFQMEPVKQFIKKLLELREECPRNCDFILSYLKRGVDV